MPADESHPVPRGGASGLGRRFFGWPVSNRAGCDLGQLFVRIWFSSVCVSADLHETGQGSATSTVGRFSRAANQWLRQHDARAHQYAQGDHRPENPMPPHAAHHTHSGVRRSALVSESVRWRFSENRPVEHQVLRHAVHARRECILHFEPFLSHREITG